MNEIAEAIMGIVISIIFIAVGVIIMRVLYPVNPFMAVVGMILLIIFTFAVIIGVNKSHT
ncbi:MAG: hypothetical protein NWF10_03730 [Candidatus Bathyarchaeota archaeon]|nr:hypothetical protein [Candidatus Bathyarchaeota archaeon]